MLFKRVLLKLSGETFASANYSIAQDAVLRTANEIKVATENENLEIAVVVGAGNIWRGAGKFVERVAADKIGMMSTVVNSLVLSEALNSIGVRSEVFCANGVSGFVQNFDSKKVVNCIENKVLAVLGGGTGNPFFTTDTAAALRAAEINAGIILKATQVDGIYSADPKKDSKAMKFETLKFHEILDKNLKIMDIEAFSLCQKYGIRICVFDFYKNGNLKKILCGEKIGTIVEG
ncbi:MAG: UMP kinase [Elusimicrobiota bacterium]|jgi:uridylate kinase|nr:UMP kinase [Elusimicrobiota bacterium]